jgi:predicted signal transduction protein with EAL and GGDEF domain
MLKKPFQNMSDTSKKFNPLCSLGDAKLWQRAVRALAQTHARLEALMQGDAEFAGVRRCFRDDVTETWTCQQVVSALKADPAMSDQELQRICLSCLARRALQQGFALKLKALALKARSKGMAL